MKLAALGAFLVVFISCNSTSMSSDSDAGGAPYELIASVEQSAWEGVVGEALKEVFHSPVEFINQQEPIFDILRIQPSGLKGLLLSHRNILIVSIDPEQKEPRSFAQEDRFTKGQLVVSLIAPTQKAMARYIVAHKQELVTLFEDNERDIALARNKKYYNHELQEQIKEMFGLELDIPVDYKWRGSTGDNMLVMSREYPLTSQGVAIYSYPYSGKEDFEVANLLKRRNEFMANIPGPSDDSYMITAREFAPDVFYKRIHGRFWAEMRGFWDVEGDFMGGPMVSFSTLDVATNMVVTIDCYVFSPEKPKRNLLRGVEHLVYSAEFAKPYEPTTANIKAREEFQDNKFGIFIHWGISSMLGDGEWVLHNKKINHKEYAKLADTFYPSKFNADEWVDVFKKAGAKYITITTRHHDGFSLFDSKYTDFDVIDATPFKRDIIKELAEACALEGIKLNFYYSHLDWMREDYPIGRTGIGVGRELKPNWNQYYKFMNNQLTELLTNYGKIGSIWFDGYWDKDQQPDFDWQLPNQYALIHRLQDDCLIANNHHVTPILGEDIQVFERDLPGENIAGLSGQKIGQLPLETCQTMNRSWGYRITDTTYKSKKELIQYLVRAAGKNANLLLNIGPLPSGELPKEGVERLLAMGEWLSVNGESVYGSRGCGIIDQEWGTATIKGDKIYLHILKELDSDLVLNMAYEVTSAKIFNSEQAVEFTQQGNGLSLNIPRDKFDGIDLIIELQINNKI